MGGWRRIGLCGRLEEDWVVWEAGGGLGCVGGGRRMPVVWEAGGGLG